MSVVSSGVCIFRPCCQQEDDGEPGGDKVEKQEFVFSAVYLPAWQHSGAPVEADLWPGIRRNNTNVTYWQNAT